jgi:hypothetical protein
MNKTILFAAFVPTDKIEKFLSSIEEKLNIKKNDVFFFENLDDKINIIITFKYTQIQDNIINIREIYHNTIPIHKKGNAIYTINALNKLIEEESNLESGNIDFKAYKINWDNYQYKIILNKGNQLIISPIKRIFL